MNKIYRINFPDVISEPMESEQVVIDLKSGCYFNLNEPAAYIWRMIETGSSLEEMIKALSTNIHETDQDVALMVEEFIGKLEKEQLIIATDIIPNRGFDILPFQNIKFGIPAYQKFDDMQEMLLLDPIHEVSEAGWPNLPEGELN